MKEDRHIRKEVTGKVISDKMEKTVIVETQSHVAHPKYKKIFVRRVKFAAHDEKSVAGMGDVVMIRESRPLSKTKHWIVTKVVSKAKVRPEERQSRSVKKKTDKTAAVAS